LVALTTGRTFEAPPPYIHTMDKPRPIGPEFSGDLAALAVTLGLPIAEITASIAGLIERGNLQRISGGTYRFFPKPVR
jgi:hypothetical protein